MGKSNFDFFRIRCRIHLLEVIGFPLGHMESVIFKNGAVVGFGLVVGSVCLLLAHPSGCIVVGVVRRGVSRPIGVTTQISGVVVFTSQLHPAVGITALIIGEVCIVAVRLKIGLSYIVNVIEIDGIVNKTGNHTVVYRGGVIGDLNVCNEAVKYVEDALWSLGATEVKLRAAAAKDGPAVTEHGNLLIDCKVAKYGSCLEHEIKDIPGVIESGLFQGYSFEYISPED